MRIGRKRGAQPSARRDPKRKPSWRSRHEGFLCSRSGPAGSLPRRMGRPLRRRRRESGSGGLFLHIGHVPVPQADSRGLGHGPLGWGLLARAFHAPQIRCPSFGPARNQVGFLVFAVGTGKHFQKFVLFNHKNGSSSDLSSRPGMPGKEVPNAPKIPMNGMPVQRRTAYGKRRPQHFRCGRLIPAAGAAPTGDCGTAVKGVSAAFS